MKPLATLLAISAASATAQADHWLDAELPAAAAITGVQQQTFRTGAMPALGAYLGNPSFAIGVRLRAGVLRDGSAPGGNVMDPGTGGLATGGVAARLGAAGGWAELVAGGGITGHDAVPAFEAGIGWSFAAGGVGVGPSVRYMRVVGAGDAPGSADVLLVGVDVAFHHRAPTRLAAPVHVEAAPAPLSPPPAALPLDSDDDDIADGDTSCSDLMVAGDPTSGCPALAAITVIDDRIILDDRVLFDTDRAHVKTAGRHVIAQIADAWKAHPEWKAITIEGHADVRGPDAWNVELSQLRAERVRAVLLRHGFGADAVKAIGYGRSRPRDLGTSDLAHEHNRRVEFVIERSTP